MHAVSYTDKINIREAVAMELERLAEADELAPGHYQSVYYPNLSFTIILNREHPAQPPIWRVIPDYPMDFAITEHRYWVQGSISVRKLADLVLSSPEAREVIFYDSFPGSRDEGPIGAIQNLVYPEPLEFLGLMWSYDQVVHRIPLILEKLAYPEITIEFLDEAINIVQQANDILEHQVEDNTGILMGQYSGTITPRGGEYYERFIEGQGDDTAFDYHNGHIIALLELLKLYIERS